MLNPFNFHYFVILPVRTIIHRVNNLEVSVAVRVVYQWTGAECRPSRVTRRRSRKIWKNRNKKPGNFSTIKVVRPLSRTLRNKPRETTIRSKNYSDNYMNDPLPQFNVVRMAGKRKSPQFLSTSGPLLRISQWRGQL